MIVRAASRLALAGLGVAGTLALAACGFTPLYATPGVSPGLSAIEVSAPQGRVGYLLREQLDDTLARNRAVAPTFRLELQIVQSRDPRGLRRDDVAERYELGATVRYVLIEIATTPYVLWMDDDSHVLPDWDRELLRFLRE